jgi:hypothetical protein
MIIYAMSMNEVKPTTVAELLDGKPGAAGRGSRRKTAFRRRFRRR